MKNFKRVISAVIALALSASTLVAVSASKFADVDGTNYAEAIDVLTALDVIHGYEEEDGLVFKPDGEITRAEAATMIVGALNMNADAKAAAGVSKFTDVNEKASWATGYVNVGVAQGFINGMDDTTFAPQENVTYAQMCVMLTLITGYGDYAKTYGGWPTGYTTMAASAGINKGVAVSNDTPLKRGQVAQMLYNAVTTPVLGISEYRLDGNSYKKLDGSGEKGEYKTILSDKFDGYVVKATVDKFDKAGEVDFKDVKSDYTKAVNNDDYFDEKDTIKGVIIENGLDLSNLIQLQVRAILYVDADGKKHVVYATQTDSVETKEVEAADYVAGNAGNKEYKENGKIKFGSTKYQFADTIKVYANGEEFEVINKADSDPDAEIKRILDASKGTVKLAKLNDATNYNAIFVDAYIMGQVRSVTYKNEVTTVKFASPTNNLVTSYKQIEIADNDVETGTVKVKVTLDGQEIELKDIQENDVIAIKTVLDKDSSESTIGSDNKNITVLVSRETISGKVSSIENGDGENAYTIDSTEYEAVDKKIDLAVGKLYNTIYLDSFGRIYGYNDETIEDTKKYAILARVSDSTDIVLVLPDGTKKNYEAKSAEIFGNTENAIKALEVSNGPVTSEGKSVVGTAADATKAVVEYTVKNGQINTIKQVEGVGFEGKEYRESVSKVDTVGISDVSGIIVADTKSYKDFTTMKASDFINEEEYSGAGFGKIGTTTNYSLIVITEAGFDFGANSRFAVANAAGYSTGTDSDGDPVEQLKVLLDGEKTTLNFLESAKKDVKYGDAFFYHLDSDGLVDYMRVIDRDSITGAGKVDFSDVFAKNGGKDVYNKNVWTNDITATGKDVKLVKGLVVKVGTNSVSLIEKPSDDDKPFDVDKYETFSLADDCLIYTYDTNKDVLDRNKLDESGILVGENFKNWRITQEPGKKDGDKVLVEPQTGYTKSDIGKIAWDIKWSDTPKEDDLTARGIVADKYFAALTYTANKVLKGYKASDDAQYALALIVNDEVVEIYQILAD